MPEEIDIKLIQKQKKAAEKMEKDAQKKKQKEENRQETKTIKIKKNTVMNKAANPPAQIQPQKKEFSEYKDAFILSYFEIIAKSCAKYIANIDENTLKKRLMTSRDLDSLLSYLLTLQIENPVILLLITTLSHILNDSVQNKFIKEIRAQETAPPLEQGAAGLDMKDEENKKSNI
jgi:ribosome-binding ATPase YchF (GTP1/OBG family)